MSGAVWWARGALVALVLLVSIASAENRELLVKRPSFLTGGGTDHFDTAMAFVDDIYNALRFDSLVGRERGVAGAPSQFTADASFTSNLEATSGDNTITTLSMWTGHIARDQVWGMVANGSLSSSVAPDVDPVVQQAIVLNQDASYMVKNDICSEGGPQNITAYDQVLTLPVVGDEDCPEDTGVTGTCQHLAYSQDAFSVDAYTYTIDEEEDTVVILSVAISTTFDGSVSMTNGISLLFTDYNISPDLSESDFDGPVACNRAFYESCGSIAEEGTVELYVFTAELPTDEFDLSNAMAGDVYAAAGDICDVAFSMSANETTGFVTRVTLTLDRNYDMMHAKNGEGRVQHSGALYYGDGDYAGQCSDNEGIGNWYYFPAEGECGEGETVGENPCYWDAVINTTSIYVSCFLEYGIQDACATAYQLPFTAAAGIVQSVFDANYNDDTCVPFIMDSYSEPVVVDDGDDNNDNDDTDSSVFVDGGWYWLALTLTLICVGLILLVAVLGAVAFKFKDRLVDIPIFAMLAREPQPGGDYDNSQWKTITEGGSNGLLDGDLMDDDDLDLTFD